MLRKLWVLKHHQLDVWLKSPKMRTTTKDVQEAFRALTQSEASSWAQRMTPPIAWTAVQVDFDTLKGRVVESSSEGSNP